MTQDLKSSVLKDKLLLKHLFPWILLSGLLGVVSGTASAKLIASFNYYTNSKISSSLHAIAPIVGLILISIASEGISNRLNLGIGQRIVRTLRHIIFDTVLTSYLDLLEHQRKHDFLMIVSRDVNALVSAFNFLPSLCISLCIIAASMCYAIFADWRLGFPIILIAGLGVAGSLVLRAKTQSNLLDQRRAENTLYLHLELVLDAAKELRLNAERRERILINEIEPAIDRISNVELASMSWFIAARMIDQSAIYCGAIFLLFAPTVLDVHYEEISTFILILLFVKGYIEFSVGTIPVLGRATLAFARIQGLMDVLRSNEMSSYPEKHEISCGPARIEVRNVVYRPPGRVCQQHFELGPLNAIFRRREISFIVGANGSGKTTFAKILAGLFVPTEGVVLFDDEELTDRNRDFCRQSVSASFVDSSTFDDVVIDGRTNDKAVNSLLSKLNLEEKTQCRSGSLSASKLSTGERKKVALLQVLVDDRGVMIFDECTANFDPGFRAEFYNETLPTLKALDKIVIVITHDEEFSGVADQLIRLCDGKIIAGD